MFQVFTTLHIKPIKPTFLKLLGLIEPSWPNCLVWAVIELRFHVHVQGLYKWSALIYSEKIISVSLKNHKLLQFSIYWRLGFYETFDIWHILFIQLTCPKASFQKHTHLYHGIFNCLAVWFVTSSLSFWYFCCIRFQNVFPFSKLNF